MVQGPLALPRLVLRALEAAQQQQQQQSADLFANLLDI